MLQTEETIPKRLLRTGAALIGVIATAAVATWAISMPKSDLRGVWQTEGYGYVTCPC